MRSWVILRSGSDLMSWGRTGTDREGCQRAEQGAGVGAECLKELTPGSLAERDLAIFLSTFLARVTRNRLRPLGRHFGRQVGHQVVEVEHLERIRPLSS